MVRITDVLAPRRFVLDRGEDETGVSGTGIVATGVAFGDGRAVTRWCSNGSDVHQTCVWDSMDHVERVHGHHGKTRVRWLDEYAEIVPPAAADPAPTDPAWTIDDDGNPRCGDVATVVASTHRGVAVRCDTTGTTAVFPMEAHAALVALIRCAADPAPTDSGTDQSRLGRFTIPTSAPPSFPSFSAGHVDLAPTGDDDA